MKVVVRCIYYKPVTPSCDIIDMDDETWREFLYAKPERRKEIALKLLGKEEMNTYVRELVWIPLDEHITVKIKKRIRQKPDPPRPKHSKEEIERCRQEVVEEIKKVNDPDISDKLKQDEIDRIMSSPDFVFNDIMDYSSPETYVYYLFM